MKYIFMCILLPAIAFADCDGNSSQAELLQCGIDEYAQTKRTMDQQLTLLEHCTKISTKSDQTQWYKTSESECRNSLKSDKGGSIYQYLYVICMEKKTDYRIKELRYQLQSCFK